ncbi:hypothetical protein PINS_up010478 [Pythium insidiosum]|nr:hypothetical protein PINS_up010478 [Pythium insidiosum]
MGKQRARQAAALRAHAAVNMQPEDTQSTAQRAAASSRTPHDAAEDDSESSRHSLRVKIELLRGAAPRSAAGLSKIYLNAQDMGRIGVMSGATVALVSEDSTSYAGAGAGAGHDQKLLLCGLAWPLDKVKRNGVGVNSMWEEHLTGRTHARVVALASREEAPRIRRCEASAVTLSLVSRGGRASDALSRWPSEAERPTVTRYVLAMLHDAIVHADARLSLSIHGVQTVFRVVSIDDAVGVVGDASTVNNVYRVSPTTKLAIEWAPRSTSEPFTTVTDAPSAEQAPTSSVAPRNSVGFAAIGGLREEIETIRQIIEQPLTNPELFARFGLPPPKGLLMFGPPGTGKTLIARALAAELRASIFFINGPEVVSKYIGESESNLRDIFRDARKKSPSLIFIDEIDAICPKRDGRVGEMEKRMVATLLTLMDGLDQGDQGRVVVLAATNRPNALDPAIRRPGRFDREVEISIPNADARFEILRVSLARLPHAIPEDALRALSDAAHGYVGADLSAMCKEAALLALQRASRTNTAFAVEEDDLRRAMRGIRPSALREIAVDVPHVLWQDIGGQHMIKQQLKEAVEWPLRHPEAFVRMGIRPPKGVLLYGPPGCSKTLTAKALATESGMNFIAIKGPELFSKWVGESEKAVQSVFRKARAAAPTVVFFDEIDAIATQRGGDGSSQVADRVLSQLLTELDGIEPLKQVLVVAATNRPDLIDSALLRPGRIDRVLYVGPPDETARREILAIHCRRMPLGDDVALDALAVATEGFSGAELYALCREAAMRAIEEDRDAQCVALRHFEAARERVTPQIDDAMLRFFHAFRDGKR